MSEIVECPKCRIRITAQQAERQVACTTQDCPLPKPDEAGRIWTDATDKDREKMTGIFIGQEPYKVRQTSS